MFRPRPFAISFALALSVLLLLGGVASSYDDLSDEVSETAANPCAGPDAGRLRCPDLQMRRPVPLRDRAHPERPRPVARDQRDQGKGPRAGRAARPPERPPDDAGPAAHYRVEWGRAWSVPSSVGHLYFYFIPGQGRYWKFANAARFELWSVDGNGRRERAWAA